MKRLIAIAAVLTVVPATTALGAAARSTTGTIHAHISHGEGTDLYVAGDLKDKLLGRGAIVYVTNPQPDATGGILVKARRITVYFPTGTLTGTGQATQTVTPTASTVSGGTFSLTKGTGRYKGRSLRGTFSGTQDSDGIYTFTYKGKLR